MLNQSTHSNVANSTSSTVRHSPRRRITSVFEEGDHRPGQGVVVRIAGAAHGRRRCRLPRGVRGSGPRGTACPGRYDAPGRPGRAPRVNRLLQSIQDQVGAQRRRHAPPDDATREGIYDEGHEDNDAAPRGHARQVGHPE